MAEGWVQPQPQQKQQQHVGFNLCSWEQSEKIITCPDFQSSIINANDIVAMSLTPSRSNSAADSSSIDDTATITTYSTSSQDINHLQTTTATTGTPIPSSSASSNSDNNNIHSSNSSTSGNIKPSWVVQSSQNGSLLDASTFADSASATTATTTAYSLAFVQSQLGDCLPPQTPQVGLANQNKPINPEEEFLSACLLRAGSECGITSIPNNLEENETAYAAQQVAEIVKQKLQQCSGSTIDDKSFYAFNLGAVRRNVHKWCKLFPNCKLLHSLQNNCDTAVLEVAAFSGTEGFVCAFPGHWSQLSTASASVKFPNLMIYDGGLGKTSASMEAARCSGAQLIVIDTIGDVHRVFEAWNDSMLNVQLIIRLASEFALNVNEDEIIIPMAYRRIGGIRLREWSELIDTVKKYGFVIRGVKIDGFGYSTPDEHLEDIALSSIADQIEKARQFYYYVANSSNVLVGEEFIINLGSVPLKSDSSSEAVEGYRKLLDSITTITSAGQQANNICLYADPSDFVLSHTGFLATRVFARRYGIGKIEQKNPVLYYICDGIYHNLGSKVYSSSKFEPQVLLSGDHPQQSHNNQSLSSNESSSSWLSNGKIPCKIFGQTCDGFDCVLEEYENLPLLEVGDWLWFDSQGSNGNITTNFNGFDIGNKIYTCVL